jgi:hypothetical protein
VPRWLFKDSLAAAQTTDQSALSPNNAVDDELFAGIRAATQHRIVLSAAARFQALPEE